MTLCRLENIKKSFKKHIFQYNLVAFPVIAVITFAKWSNTQLPGNCNSHHEKPLQASALNTVKFIWEILKQHVRERPPPPSSKHHIREDHLGRTAFHPCCRVSEKWKIKSHWSCSGSLWWPNTFKFKQVSPPYLSVHAQLSTYIVFIHVSFQLF